MVKTLRLFLVAALAMVFGNVMADEVIMAYPSGSTTNMTGNNDAALVGLDANKWSVVGAKGGCNNFPGLNQAGDIRLYYNASGSNTITVESLEGATINSITITFTGDNYSKVTVTANGSAVTGTGGTYAINSSSFVLGNGNTTNTQVRIKSIVINYSASSDTRAATTIEFADGYDVRFTYGPQGEDVSLPTATVKAGDTPINATVTWALTKDAAFHVGDAEPAIEGNKVKPSNHSYGKLTLTASYAGDASNKPSSKSYTLTVFKGRMSIAEFMDEFLKTYNEGGDLSSWKTHVPTSYWQLERSGDQITNYNAIVTYVNGSYTYIRDDKGRGLLLYGSNLGVKKGDVITGDLGGVIGAIYGELYAYNGLMELATTADQTLFYVKEHGQTVTPTTITCDKLVENMNNYVEIKNAEYTSTTISTGSNPKKTFTFKVGDKEFAAYDVWKLGDTQEFTVGEKYTLTGFGALYINADATVKTPQLYFESATAEGTGIEAVKAAGVQFEGKMFNLAGQVVNKAYKGMVIMNGRKFVNK